MRVELRSRDIEIDEQLRQGIERRLTNSLSRFNRLIQRVVVRIERIRGLAIGLNYRCHIHAKLTGRMSIVVDVRDVSLEHVLSRASARVTRRLREKSSSRTENENGRHVTPLTPEVIWISET